MNCKDISTAVACSLQKGNVFRHVCLSVCPCTTAYFFKIVHLGPKPLPPGIPMLFNVFPYLSYEMDWNLFLTVPVSRQPNINCLICISSVIETFDVLSPFQRKMPTARTAFPASYRCWTLILDPTLKHKHIIFQAGNRLSFVEAIHAKDQ